MNSIKAVVGDLAATFSKNRGPPGLAGVRWPTRRGFEPSPSPSTTYFAENLSSYIRRLGKADEEEDEIGGSS
jgi:hypothetical protein